MKKPRISIISAIAKNRAIGKDNKLLFHIPEDMKRFRGLTEGHSVIMGRKTFQSIGKPLPNRTNIVITGHELFKAPGVVVVHSFDEALKAAKGCEKEEIFIIGGGQIYAQAMQFADKLYLTVVEGSYEADTYFPDYSDFDKVVFEQEGESAGYKYKFLELEK